MVSRTQKIGAAIGVVVTGVVGSLIVWLITGCGGNHPFCQPPPPPPARADISITEFYPYKADSNSIVRADITVYNNGDEVAQECMLQWSVGTSNTGSTVLDSERYGPFGVAPNESKKITMNNRYEGEGRWNSSVWLQCRNGASETFERVVYVIL